MRYKLCLPLVFEWTDENGTVIQGAGFTRDVSTSGVFVTCDDLPPIKSAIRLQIALPSNKQVFPESLRLTATAEVLRFAGDGESAGFVAVGELAGQERRRQSEIHVVDRPPTL